jgi:hypothetical protein
MKDYVFKSSVIVSFLSAMQAPIHKQNRDKGWWLEAKTPSMQACLFTSESSEALEGYRKDLMDDKLEQYPMIAVELADIIIRGLDHLGAYNVKWTTHDSSMPIKLSPDVLYNLAFINWHISQWWFDHAVRNEGGSGHHHLKRACCIAYALAMHLDFPIATIIEQKLAYNRVRPDHVYENRTDGKAGSKKF